MRMIFQKPYGSLNPREKVKDIIGAPLKIHHTVPESGLEDEVLRLMDMVGLNREWAKPLPPRVFGRPEAENRNCQGAGRKPGVNNLR